MRRSSRTPTPPERSWAGGCAVHASASASTSRSTSSTAVVPSRSSSAGCALDHLDRRRLGGDAAERARRAAPARPRAAARRSARRAGRAGPRDQPMRAAGGVSPGRASRTLPTGGPAASRSSTSRSAGRQSAIMARDPCRVGQHVGDGGAGARLRRGRQAERAQHRRQRDVRDLAQQRRGRPAQPGRVGAERLAHRGRQVHVVAVAPDQGERAQLGQGGVDRTAVVASSSRVAASTELRRSPSAASTSASSTRRANASEPVDGALDRRAHAEPAGQRRQVGRRRQGEVGAEPQQLGELARRCGRAATRSASTPSEPGGRLERAARSRSGAVSARRRGADGRPAPGACR